MTTAVPYEDVQSAATHIAQCAMNALTVIKIARRDGQATPSERCSRLSTDPCNNEEARSISTSLAPTTFPTTMTPMSSPCGPIQVDLFLLKNTLSVTSFPWSRSVCRWQRLLVANRSDRPQSVLSATAEQADRDEDHEHTRSAHQRAQGTPERGPDDHDQYLYHLHVDRVSLTLGTLTQNSASDRRCSHAAASRHADQWQQHNHLAPRTSHRPSLAFSP